MNGSQLGGVPCLFTQACTPSPGTSLLPHGCGALGGPVVPVARLRGLGGGSEEQWVQGDSSTSCALPPAPESLRRPALSDHCCSTHVSGPWGGRYPQKLTVELLMGPERDPHGHTNDLLTPQESHPQVRHSWPRSRDTCDVGRQLVRTVQHDLGWNLPMAVLVGPPAAQAPRPISWGEAGSLPRTRPSEGWRNRLMHPFICSLNPTMDIGISVCENKQPEAWL